MLWDLFCRVVDNFGDAGVCWRAACDLGSRGEHVRLWIDDATPLVSMAPDGCQGVQVLAWPEDDVDVTPGDAVVEAFGCNPPAWFVARMALSAPAPVWINLEYLSAEGYVERSHALPSPQTSGPGAGLLKWFFYPGFTERTGGLLREPDLLSRQRRFDPHAWLDSRGLHRRANERIVSLFCYETAPVPGLLDTLGQQPTLILAAPGAASTEVSNALGRGLTRGMLRAALLPFLPQIQYDHMLWASDLNVVRGEDSFVRAQWAARPFLWHIYAQADGAHARKLKAFCDRFLADAPDDLAAGVDRLSRWWNGLADEAPLLPSLDPWAAHCLKWRAKLLAQADLSTQLVGFVEERR